LFFIRMKTINFIISTVVTIMLIAPAGVGFAQSSIDLGTESSGLLPSNPFYFLKEWGRGFRKFIAFNPIKKAELELSVVSEKAAELQKLEEITPDKSEAISGAISNYRQAIENLRLRLDSLKENSGNPSIDRLLTELTSRALRHQQLFDVLRLKFESDEKITQDLEELKDKVAETVAVGLEKLDIPEKSKERLQKAIDEQKDELKEFKIAGFIDRLEEKLSGGAKDAVRAVKDDLLIKFSGRLQGLELAAPGTPASLDLENVSGEQLRQLKLLDEVREKVTTPNLKSELNAFRQKVLDNVEESNGISEADAKLAVENAERVIRELESKIPKQARAALKELLERAKFNLDQAKELLDDGNFGGAFGQATAANAAAKNALMQLSPNLTESGQGLKLVKNYYDSLVNRVRSSNITKDQNPKLFELLTDAEKKIIELTRLIESKAAPEIVAAILRDVKLILATAEELIAASLRSAPSVSSGQAE